MIIVDCRSLKFMGGGENQMILIRCFIFLGLTGTVGAFFTENETKYLREDCISRIEIAWDSNPSLNKENSIELIFKVVLEPPYVGYNKVPPSIALQGENREFIYLQYKFDCVNKEINTLKIIRRLQELLDVNMVVSKGKFSPNVETIRSYGDWWIDSNSN